MKIYMIFLAMCFSQMAVSAEYEKGLKVHSDHDLTHNQQIKKMKDHQNVWMVPSIDASEQAVSVRWTNIFEYDVSCKAYIRAQTPSGTKHGRNYSKTVKAISPNGQVQSFYDAIYTKLDNPFDWRSENIEVEFYCHKEYGQD